MKKNLKTIIVLMLIAFAMLASCDSQRLCPAYQQHNLNKDIKRK